MSANERVKGIQVHRPIIYGSHARLLTDEEKASAPLGHTHRWTVFLTSATSPPPNKASNAASSSTDPFPEDINYLPGGADDLSYLIKKVTFRLHDTYPNPNRVFDKPPFQVSETGWGEFTVQIRIQFIQESSEKPMTLNHPIKLHHWGAPIQPSSTSAADLGLGISGDALTSAAATPTASAIAGDAGAGERESVKPETADTPIPAPAPASEGPKVEVGTPATLTAPGTPADAEQIEVEPTQVSINNDLTAGGGIAGAGAGSGSGIGPNGQPLSVASKFPVHSWQYDELVFSDPTRSFLDILNEHPPTPLPKNNRRPRDQREEYDRGKSQLPSKKKGRQSIAPSVSNRNSRANTMETTGVEAAAVAESGFTPAPGQAQGNESVVVGIAGELGSADVPLEFSQEMEKAEWNRLNDARIKIIEQMDRWRERLIEQEKELAKAKEQVKALS